MKKFMSLFLALVMVCSLSVTAFAAGPMGFSSDCAICGNTFKNYSGAVIENRITYQEYYSVDDISELENYNTGDNCVYSVDDPLYVAKNNGEVICKSCLESIVNEYKASQPVTPPSLGNETVITYTGEGSEAYTITVPTTLEPGQSGEVKVQGTWASNRKLSVSAPSSVTLVDSIDHSTKPLAVTFAGIAKIGDNTVAVSDTKTVSVADISNVLFGTWTGTITYTVSMKDV